MKFKTLKEKLNAQLKVYEAKAQKFYEAKNERQWLIFMAKAEATKEAIELVEAYIG